MHWNIDIYGKLLLFRKIYRGMGRQWPMNRRKLKDWQLLNRGYRGAGLSGLSGRCAAGAAQIYMGPAKHGILTH